MKQTDQAPILPLWINGRAVLTITGQFADVRRAEDGAVLRRTPVCGASEVADAVAAAQAALPVWQATPGEKRIAALQELANALAELADHFTCILVDESGKTAKDARAEVEAAVGVLREWTQAPTPTPSVVALLCDGVSPLVAPAALLAAVVAAGATAVIRPGAGTPSALYGFLELAERSGVASGVLNLVYGGDACAEVLLVSPAVRAAAFAGGEEEATRLREVARRHEKLLFSCSGQLCMRCCNWLKVIDLGARAA